MIILLYVIGWSIVYLYAFLLAFIATMGIYRVHLAGRLQGPLLWALFPFVALAVIMDLFAQFTLASLIFMQMPYIEFNSTSKKWLGRTWTIPSLTGDWLVTSRLQRYMTTADNNWRYSIAFWICESVLDFFDPRGEHC
jgi:hypothetical protein